MHHFMGGKRHLAPKFAPILRESLVRTGGQFVEPFVGGFNVVPAILGDFDDKAYCFDLHPGLIKLYSAIKNGWEPPDHLTEENLKRLMRFKNWSDPLTAFAAFGCVYRGVEWGGYAGEKSAGACKRSLLRKKPAMKQCLFECCTYREVNPLYVSTIYCDPPYKKTSSIRYSRSYINYSRFNQWCEDQVESGHEVFVSGFEAPVHWELVWSTIRKMMLRPDAKFHEREDKLFRVRAR